jgi:hypothetical protein
VVVVVVVVVGGDVPDTTGLFVVFSGGVALGTAGWALIDAVTGGQVVVGVLVVGVVLAVLGRGPFSVSACVRGACELFGNEGEVEDDVIPEDVVMGTPEGGAVSQGDGNGVVYPLAAMALGARGDEPGPSATATTITTMPRTEAAPIVFCSRRTFFFCSRRTLISPQTASHGVADSWGEGSDI